MDEIGKLKKIIDKLNVQVEKIDWSKAELRSNEIDIAHEHLRKALQEFDETLQFQRLK